MSFSFLVNSFFLGVGLAMDAFSVSVANGLSYPKMKSDIKFKIAFVFAFCQFIMPVLGWGFVTLLTGIFTKISRFIPWIAFAMLLFIGGKMIFEAVSEMASKRKDEKDGEKTGAVDNDKVEVGQEPGKETETERDALKSLTLATLTVQGIATSLDALSAGFTIAEYSAVYALLCAGIIAVVTCALCLVGVILGKKIGERISSVATIFGGSILILIGIKILLGF